MLSLDGGPLLLDLVLLLGELPLHLLEHLLGAATHLVHSADLPLAQRHGRFQLNDLFLLPPARAGALRLLSSSMVQLSRQLLPLPPLCCELSMQLPQLCVLLLHETVRSLNLCMHLSESVLS